MSVMRPIRWSFTQVGGQKRVTDDHAIAPTGYRLGFEQCSAISTATRTGNGSRLKSAMRSNSDILVSFGYSVSCF